jgi:hypothetical protein
LQLPQQQQPLLPPMPLSRESRSLLQLQQPPKQRQQLPRAVPAALHWAMRQQRRTCCPRQVRHWLLVRLLRPQCRL